MFAKSKTLSLVLFPALLLPLLLVLTVEGEAVEVSPERAVYCDRKRTDCINECSDKTEDCGPIGSKDRTTCMNDCTGICDLKESDCLRGEATRPKPLPKTKVQPKVKPGGVETPGTESPNVQPKGGIQQIP